MEVKKFILSHNKKIVDALEKLNKIKEGINLTLFVYDNDKKIIGSITDGDIRRSLIEDKDINKRLGEICFRDFTYILDSKKFVDLEFARRKEIKVLPVLNNDLTLNRIIDLDKTKGILPLDCVIMAGGRGKRLSPLTDITPKPMLLLGDKPIIEHTIDRLISFGIRKFFVSLNYLGEKIQSYLGDGSSKGIEIEYVWEENPLGTAGSLSLIKEFNSDHVLIMNADLFTDVNFEKMYNTLINEKADMVVASKNYKVDVPYAIFENKNNRVSGFKEKPSFIFNSNAGIYIVNKQLIDSIPKNSFYNITDLMYLIIRENKKLIHEPILGYWVDIGSTNDYQNAQELIKHLKR